MKDWLLKRGAEAALKVVLRDLGKVRSLSLNSTERWCEIDLDLHGETESIQLRAEEVNFRSEEKRVYVRVGKLRCTRAWLSRLGEQHVVGKEFLLPPKAATAVRFLL